jgi:uncharacterized membrane protein YfcA
MSPAIILVAIGLVAGALSGLLGIGGGVIIVPALIYLLRMTPQQAAGTSLAALVIPLSAAIGAYTYYKAGALRVQDGLLIAVGMAVGAYFGSKLGTHMDATTVKRIFAVLMVAMAAKMWTS